MCGRLRELDDFGNTVMLVSSHEVSKEMLLQWPFQPVPNGIYPDIS